MHRQHVLSIDDHAGHGVRTSALRDVGYGRRLPLRRGGCIAVVFAQKTTGNFQIAAKFKDS
jgi:hypothetical protein